MEIKSVSDFSVFCPVCGIEQNLYDIAEGRCMICGTDLTTEKKKLMKVLLAQDIFFDCDENGRILVPEDADPQTTEKATPKPLQKKEKTAKQEKPAGRPLRPEEEFMDPAG